MTRHQPVVGLSAKVHDSKRTIGRFLKSKIILWETQQHGPETSHIIEDGVNHNSAAIDSLNNLRSALEPTSPEKSWTTSCFYRKTDNESILEHFSTSSELDVKKTHDCQNGRDWASHCGKTALAWQLTGAHCAG
jgi:hypothetical protein